jgi:hypothetical protein
LKSPGLDECVGDFSWRLGPLSLLQGGTCRTPCTQPSDHCFPSLSVKSPILALKCGPFPFGTGRLLPPIGSGTRGLDQSPLRLRDGAGQRQGLGDHRPGQLLDLHEGVGGPRIACSRL